MKHRIGIKLFRGADVICIALTVLLSIMFLLLAKVIFGSTSTPILKIEANGTTEYYSLNEDRSIEITSQGYTLTVRISEGSAYVEHSTCPDGVCKTMGKISQNGQIAVCAPAQVAITVEDAHSGEEAADAITR